MTDRSCAASISVCAIVSSRFIWTSLDGTLIGVWQINISYGYQCWMVIWIANYASDNNMIYLHTKNCLRDA